MWTVYMGCVLFAILARMGAQDGLRDKLPQRWVVRRGEPCKVSALAEWLPTYEKGDGEQGVRRGLHLYMEPFMSVPALINRPGDEYVRRCLWCDRRENDRGTGWTVVNPNNGDYFQLPDYRSAVRHASKGWHASLDPLEHRFYLMVKSSRIHSYVIDV